MSFSERPPGSMDGGPIAIDGDFSSATCVLLIDKCNARHMRRSDGNWYVGMGKNHNVILKGDNISVRNRIKENFRLKKIKYFFITYAIFLFTVSVVVTS